MKLLMLCAVVFAAILFVPPPRLVEAQASTPISVRYWIQPYQMGDGPWNVRVPVHLMILRANGRIVNDDIEILITLPQGDTDVHARVIARLQTRLAARFAPDIVPVYDGTQPWRTREGQ